jgi:hypothetical protein
VTHINISNPPLSERHAFQNPDAPPSNHDKVISATGMQIALSPFSSLPYFEPVNTV